MAIEKEKRMNISSKIVALLLSVLGIYYIFTLLTDGAKLQRFRKKYYTIYSTDSKEEETNESKLQ